MCKYKAASYRMGSIVEAIGTGGNKLALDVKSARKIGRAVSQELDEYMTEISEAAEQYIEAFVSELELTVDTKFFDLDDWTLCRKTEAASVAARFAPGLVLDFPSLVLTSKGCSVHFRSCLTVCIGDMRSKIWTRCVTKVSGGPNEIPEEEVETLHDFFEGVCGAINLAIKALYERDFTLQAREDVKLATYGQVKIFAVDCEGEVVEREIEGMCDELKAEPATRLIEEPELAAALRDITRVSVPSIGWDKTDSETEFLLGDDADYFPHRGSNGVGSVFVTCAHDGTSYFSGVVNSDENQIPQHFERRGDYSNSTGTIAEVATFIGSIY